MTALPPRVKDIAGRRFGMLLVLGYAGTSPRGRSWRGANWNVRCDCGAEKQVLSRHLVSGQARSCGPCGHRAGSARRWARPEERERARVTANRQFEDPAQRQRQVELKRELYGTAPPPQFRAANDMRQVMAALRAQATRVQTLKQDRLRAIAARAHARTNTAKQEA